MRYSQIAGTGVNVSAIGFGTVKIGRDQGVKYPSSFTIPDDNSVRHLLRICRKRGINLLDTAPAYGRSEERLGALLAPGERQDWVISSKAGETFDQRTGQSIFDFSEAAIIASVERSLRRLKTDYLDIVMIHSDGNDLKIIEQDRALNTLEKLKQQGKIRATGMSTKTIAGGIAALQQSDCAMVTYNLAHQEELPVIEFAREHQRGIFVKKAFASGHFNGAEYADPILASLQLIFAQANINSAVIGTINPKNLISNLDKYLQALNNIDALC